MDGAGHDDNDKDEDDDTLAAFATVVDEEYRLSDWGELPDGNFTGNGCCTTIGGSAFYCKDINAAAKCGNATEEYDVNPCTGLNNTDGEVVFPPTDVADPCGEPEAVCSEPVR